MKLVSFSMHNFSLVPFIPLKGRMTRNFSLNLLRVFLASLPLLSYSVVGKCPPENTSALNSSLAQYLHGAQLPLPTKYLGFGLYSYPGSVTFASTTTKINTDVSIDTMRYYNYYAAAMYCPITLENLTCCTCNHFNQSVTNYTIFRNDTWGTKVLLIYHEDRSEIVVTFRGSVALVNILMDVAFVSVNPDEIFEDTIKLHQGQYLSTMSIYYQTTFQILEWIKLYGNSSITKITLTGHSLGGDMAQMTTFFWSYLNQFPAQELMLITFGAPRSGNKAFVDYMNSLTIKMARVVNRADFFVHSVAVSEPSLLGDHYLHIMREVWANGTDIHFCSTTQYEDPNCSDGLDPYYSVIDHMVYLGIDYSYCYLVEGDLGVDALTNPITGPPSTWINPWVPKKVYEYGGDLEQLIMNLLYPPFG